MFGSLLRSLSGGAQAGKALKIITDATRRQLNATEIENLKREGASGAWSNEYELALIHLRVECADRYDILGILVKPLDPDVRERVLNLFDTCCANGLLCSYIIDEYQQIKADKPTSSTPAPSSNAKPTPAKSQKKWKHSEGGLINTSTNEFIPEKYLESVSTPVPGYNITSFSFSTVWVQLSEIDN